MSDLQEMIVELFRTSSRSLNIRRIVRAIVSMNELDGVDEGSIEEAVSGLLEARTIREARPGVYRLAREAARSRNKRSRGAGQRKGLNEGFPAAPLTLDETTAMSAQADDRLQLSEAIWRRMTRRAAEVAGQAFVDEDGLEIDDSSVAPGDLSSVDVVQDGVDAARRLMHLHGWSSSNRESEGLAEGALDGRVDDLRDARFLELLQPQSGSGPYTERRGLSQRQPIQSERRTARAREFGPESSAAQAIRAVLVREEKPLALGRISEQIDAPFAATPSALRKGIDAHNAARSSAGLRPLFYCDETDAVGLTEWACDDGFLQLEDELLDVVARIRERVRRRLLQRIADGDQASFEQLTTKVLAAMGFADTRLVHRADDKQLMLVAHGRQAAGMSTIAVIAQCDWAPIGQATVEALRESLSFFGAEYGIILTIGTFTDEAVEVAGRFDNGGVQLLDGRGLAFHLFRHRIGVDRVMLEVCYPSHQVME
ncbi:MAG: restriction endonuclease [Bradymonadia bacterium]